MLAICWWFCLAEKLLAPPFSAAFCAWDSELLKRSAGAVDRVCCCCIIWGGGGEPTYVCGFAHDLRRSAATRTRSSECCYGLSDLDMPSSSPSKLLSVQPTRLFATRLFPKLHAWNASNIIRKTTSQNRFFETQKKFQASLFPSILF